MITALSEKTEQNEIFKSKSSRMQSTWLLTLKSGSSKLEILNLLIPNPTPNYSNVSSMYSDSRKCSPSLDTVATVTQHKQTDYTDHYRDNDVMFGYCSLETAVIYR